MKLVILKLLGKEKLIKNNNTKMTPEFTYGDVRLGMGLYRTHKESEKYIQKSLKKKIP